MRKPDPLARLVLHARTAKEIEHSLMVTRIDAAPIVGHRNDRAAVLDPPAHADYSRPSRQKVFQSVFD